MAEVTIKIQQWTTISSTFIFGASLFLERYLIDVSLLMCPNILNQLRYFVTKETKITAQMKY